MRNKQSKSHFFLTELIVNTLFFAISAAICLSLFADGFTQSQKSRDLSEGIIYAQNAAEVVKFSNGDFKVIEEKLGAFEENGSYLLLFDENWNETSADYSYKLIISPKITDFLLSAEITVVDLMENEICSLSVSKFLEEMWVA